MRQKILITGAAGFIGANLVHDLAATGTWDIVAIDNESLGNPAQIQDLDITYVNGDIKDQELIESLLTGVDSIIHLAADTRVMDSIENPDHNFDTNVIATFGLLRAAQRCGVRRFINASTGGAILGSAEPPINETMVAQPISPYGAGKLAVEGYCSAFHGAYGLAAVSLRFSNIYGPRSYHKGSVVAHFFRSIIEGRQLTVYGDGSQQRDYLYIGDLIEGIHAALTSNISGVYQLGSGRPTSLNALLGEIGRVVGPGYPVNVNYEDFRAGEIKHTWCDISKARTELGFEPKVPLSEGLRTTWAWFLDTNRIAADAAAGGITH